MCPSATRYVLIFIIETVLNFKFKTRKKCNSSQLSNWAHEFHSCLLKFIYSEKATKLNKILTLLLTGTT